MKIGAAKVADAQSFSRKAKFLKVQDEAKRKGDGYENRGGVFHWFCFLWSCGWNLRRRAEMSSAGKAAAPQKAPLE